jgi:hypothetical protein
MNDKIGGHIRDLIPTRTRLYALPIHTGDGGEALTGYFVRLAYAHRVPFNALVRFLKGRQNVPGISASTWLHGLSGAGSAAREGAIVIGRATGHGDLHRLTLLTMDCFARDCWDNCSKWCPLCIGEMSDPDTGHIPLRWSLKGLDVCLRHNVRLIRRCQCGDANTPRTTIFACGRCARPLSENTGFLLVPDQEELLISRRIEEFFQWVRGLPARPHQNAFIALQDLIDLRISEGSAIARASSEPSVRPRRGGGIFARPRLIDTALIAVAARKPIASLFKIDDEGTAGEWCAPIWRGTRKIEWAPIFQMARKAAATGREITIEGLQQRFNVDGMLLRTTLNRHGIPWARVRRLIDPQEREELEKARDSEMLAEASAWLENGGARQFKIFHRERTPELGPWSWRRRYRSRYRRLFALTLLQTPIAVRPIRRQVNWSEVEAAAATGDADGRRPTSPELSSRFGVDSATIRTHFRRKKLALVSCHIDRMLSREEKADREAYREETVRRLAAMWRDDGNMKSFSVMLRALKDPSFDWIHRPSHERGYSKIYYEVCGPRRPRKSPPRGWI